MNRRRLSATAAGAAATLLLAGCGGDESNNSNGKAPDTDQGTSSASPSPSPSSSASNTDAPDMKFPKDVKLVFADWKTSAGPKSQAALDNAANFIRSIAHGIVQQNVDNAAYLFYSKPESQAQTYAKGQIKTKVDDGLTITGTDYYHKPKVKLSESNKRAIVSFCQDQSEIFNKEVKTGKVLRTEETMDSYLSYEVMMEKVPDVEGLWRATHILMDDGGTKCKK